MSGVHAKDSGMAENSCPVPERRPVFKYTHCDCGLLVRLEGSGRRAGDEEPKNPHALAYNGFCPSCKSVITVLIGPAP